MINEKEKRKAKPCRRVYYGLGLILLLILAGLIMMPFAETRLETWLADDPFTPLCNVGNLELAFVRENQLFTLQADGTDFQSIGIVQDMRQPMSWSPDGKWLFFIQNGKTLWFHNVEDASLSYSYPLVQAIQGTPTVAAWSSDSSHLVFAYKINENFSQLMMFQPGDMSEHTDWFQSSQSVNLYGFEWSSDSQFLYYTYSESDENESQYHGYLWDLKSSSVELIRPWEASIVGGQWSVDGRLAYLVNHVIIHVREQNGNITEFNLREPYIINFDWSPDGSQIAYLSGDTGDTVIIDSRTGKEVWRFMGIFVDWSEQGIIYYAHDSTSTNPYLRELRIANIETQSTSPAFASSAVYPRLIAQWSPDHSRILYTYDTQNYYLTLPEADSNGNNNFHILADYINFEQAWTPDGKYLTYEGENHWLYLLDLETYQSCRVVKGDENGITRYDWRIVPQE